MCGIVAIWARDRRPVDVGLIRRMSDSIAHRGPDDSGHFSADGVGLGHRRLSIVDLATGHQPMSDPDERVWMVFNGEIYNHQDLRKLYSQKGYAFQTRSDTEAIIAGYLLEGDQVVERLNGIFAFALWDTDQRRMLLARDRMGVKPLYVWQGSGLLVAASEIKALGQHPAIRTEVDEESIPEYLAFRHLAGNRSLVRDVVSLGPGEILTADISNVKVKKYWRLPRCADTGRQDISVLEEELRGLLEDACRLQLMSDVPLGTFNSGGVDSSLVTAVVSRDRSDPLKSFCAGLNSPGLDESQFAEAVAHRFGTSHHTLLIESGQFADSLPRVIWHHDEPLNHPNTVAMYLLSQMAKNQVTVVLTGEGSDELFAGYPRYRIGAGLQSLGRWGRAVLKPLADLLPASGNTRIARALSALRLGPEDAVSQASRYVSDESLYGVLQTEPTTSSLDRCLPGQISGSLVARMLEQDQRTYLLSVLNRLDKASMAFGLEAGVPILDHRIVEFAAMVSPRLKLHNGRTKYLLKKVARQWLPREIVDRRKSGLAMPLISWLEDQAGLGRYLDLLLEPRALQRGFLEPKGVHQLVAGFRAGANRQADLLWALINLEIWMRQLTDNVVNHAD